MILSAMIRVSDSDLPDLGWEPGQYGHLGHLAQAQRGGGGRHGAAPQAHASAQEMQVRPQPLPEGLGRAQLQ
jgi:hypothetical protein